MKLNWKEIGFTALIVVATLALVFRALPATVRKVIIGA